MITLEGRAGGDVAAAQAMLVERLGGRVVRRDEPALVAAGST